jgi:hypothetical protein
MKFAYMPNKEKTNVIPVAIKESPERTLPPEYENDMPQALDEVFPPKKFLFFFKKKQIQRVRELNPKEGLSKKDKFKYNFSPDKTFLITMRFSNGTMRTWMIKSKKEFFKYRKKMYHLFYENAWYNLTMKTYHLDYFDDYVEPIDRRILLRENPDESVPEHLKRAHWAVTPANVAPIIEYEYVKILATANVLNKFLKLILLVCLLIFLLCGFIAYKSSMIRAIAPVAAGK